MNPEDKVLRRLDGVKDKGGYYMALCPAHDDSNPSLSVSTGEGGKVILHCFAGCETESVVRALGLEMADLFPDRDRNRGGVPR